MTERFKYKILKYLSENDNENFIDVLHLDTDFKKLLKNLSYLRNEKYILCVKKSDTDITAKIEPKGVEYLKNFDSITSITEVNKWLIKTKWVPLAISIIAVFASIILGFKDDTKINELKERISNLEKKSESKINDAKPLKIYPTGAVEKYTNKKNDTLK
ncbi:hypothetical protein AAIP55_002356 [Flavobacterium psychrophilum]|nr:hypothetical protein [Flavobacterium psychrophilum]EKT4517936.1 hypothetical protein [Flavobacterium psychrophilum]